jgi:hypothetical protein
MSQLTALVARGLVASKNEIATTQGSISLAQPPGAATLIECSYRTPDSTLVALAQELSRVSEAVYLVRAETSSDSYVVAEFLSGQCVRRITFGRDLEVQWLLEGKARSWEVDLMFSSPAKQLVGYLSDDDSYSDAELADVERAHASRNLDGLARRPPLYSFLLWGWLKTLGVDPASPDGRLR